MEATLVLGLKRKAQPIKRLDRALHQFKSTKYIDFDINYYKLENYNYILVDTKHIQSRHKVTK